MRPPLGTTLRPRRSRAWSVVFRVSYRLIRLLDALIRSWLANGLPGLEGVVEIRTIGSRSGRLRSSLVTLIVVDGGGYVGHPNGRAAWIRNAIGAGWLEIDVEGSAERRRFTVVDDGPERDAVVRATWRQQPFPANLLYRAASRHVAAVGVYGRLDVLEEATASERRRELRNQVAGRSRSAQDSRTSRRADLVAGTPRSATRGRRSGPGRRLQSCPSTSR